jgi:HNH endonuclease
MNRYISDKLRRSVSERANFRCEYCLFPQEFFITQFHIEHIIPLKHGGQTIDENLAFSCPVCNEYKGSDLGSLDWEFEGIFIMFFNPRKDIWTNHFQFEENGSVIALTTEARVTIRILRINDIDRVEERRELIEAELY